MKMALENPMGGNFDGEFERDIDALVREQNQNRGAFDLDWNELDILRSGSAPPTVEGSRTTSASLFGHGDFSEVNCRLSGQDSGVVLSEEDLRSHPAYLSYYYSNENHNPRMPPPAISKEDWRVQQRFHPRGSSFGGIGDRRQRKESAESDGQISSLFFLQSGKDMVEQSRGMLAQNCQEQSEEWLECRSDGLMGLHDVVGLGMRRKSFADVLQEEIGHPSTVTGQLSRPVSHNAYGNIDPLRASGHISRPASRNAYENLDSIRDSDLSIMQLQNGLGLGGMQSGTTSSGLTHGQSIGSSISHSYASALGSISRSTTPDPSLIQRSSSPCLPPVGVKIGDSNRPKGFTGTDDLGDIAASLSDLSLSSKTEKDGENHATSLLNEEFSNQCELHYDVHGDKRQFLQQKIIEKSQAALKNLPIDSGYSDSSKKTGNLTDIDLVKLTMNGPKNMTKQTSNSNIYKNVLPDFSRSNSKLYNGTRGVQVMLNNQFDKEEQYVNSTGNQVGTGLHGPSMGSLYTQYLHGASDSLVHATGRLDPLDPYLDRSYIGASQMDLPECQKAYLETLFAQQKLQYDTHLKYGGLNHGFYGNHAFGIGIPFLGNPLSSSNHSSLGFGSPMRQNERSSHITSTTRSVHGDSIGPWSMENGATREGFMSSLLEEFKNNRTQSFELSDIVGYAVEFSADQYGSRFIQQKLESASVGEKRKIFPEILPRAHSLMSDVFGNYVIQKFFEYGTEDQKKQLASRLKGHVLPLSLQMYGCRVIQKALEVVDVDQQTEMVLELDGHIMKCVRDQNGNHVIQKCIERVPQGKIQFIIESFYGHVVALSTHPYGCRVIQRVLEHCDDPKTQSIMMDEIMRSVCTLAQDQYGNYVIQHVLQRGKPEERTAIISNLAGQIVKMSQQKYASNVIEKCLTYGSIEERQLLINEMLGSTDENEPLQAMMKDQFANYVVQKVIETSDDRNRELILSRIKVHLNALKRYTYGKHIVSRVEKLVAAGEKRIGVPSNSS